MGLILRRESERYQEVGDQAPGGWGGGCSYLGVF